MPILLVIINLPASLSPMVLKIRTIFFLSISHFVFEIVLRLHLYIDYYSALNTYTLTTPPLYFILQIPYLPMNNAHYSTLTQKIEEITRYLMEILIHEKKKIRRQVSVFTFAYSCILTIV